MSYAVVDQGGIETDPTAHVDVAVLIPCYNEVATIAEVVRSFRTQLPRASVFVFDNNSTDGTAREALAAGAVVIHEPRQGKGYVVQSMFRQVKADVYVMVDGDGTYPAEAVNLLIEPILRNQADMVIGSRLHSTSRSEFRWVNRTGNRMFLWLLARIVQREITDLLSGYRAFSRNFVMSMPLFAGGFDTEAEMTIRALARRVRVAEVPVNLVSRPAGSNSKIRVLHDGVLILVSMLALFRDYKPLSFFGGLGLLAVGLGLIPGVNVVYQFMATGKIAHLPSAVLALGLVLSGLILGVVGIILHVIAQRFRELDFQLQLIQSSLDSRRKSSPL